MSALGQTRRAFVDRFRAAVDVSGLDAAMSPRQLKMWIALRQPTRVLTFARNTRPFGEVKALLSEHFGSSVRLFPTTSLAAGYELVRQDVAIGALPRTLADRYGRNGRKALMEVDLGRRPAPLHFTASFVMDPPNLLASEAAALAQNVTGSAEN